jgi:hypothetical protein
MKGILVALLGATMIVSSWGGMSWAAGTHSRAAAVAGKLTGCTGRAM